MLCEFGNRQKWRIGYPSNMVCRFRVLLQRTIRSTANRVCNIDLEEHQAESYIINDSIVPIMYQSQANCR